MVGYTETALSELQQEGGKSNGDADAAILHKAMLVSGAGSNETNKVTRN